MLQLQPLGACATGGGERVALVARVSSHHAQLISSPFQHLLAIGEPQFRHRSVCKKPELWTRAMPGIHDRYVAEIEEYKAQGTPLDLVIWGDSITEAFRGTMQGLPEPCWTENRVAFEKLIGSKYRAAVFSIAGEQTFELLWRLQHGEGPQDLPVKVCMVLIGTNDVSLLTDDGEGDAERVGGMVFESIAAVLDEVAKQAPGAKLVALGLPPLQPPWFGEQERTRYQPVVDAVNQRLQQYSKERLQQGVLYWDTSSPFLLPGPERRLNVELMPDGVHPEGAGGYAMAECVLQALQAALGEG